MNLVIIGESDMEDGTITKEEILLTWQKFFAQNNIPYQKFVETSQVAINRAWWADDLVARLATYILADKWEPITEETSVSYPDGWWQHFKADCFPKWLLKRFPVKHKSVKVCLTCTPMRIYPNPPYTKLGRSFVRFEKEELYNQQEEENAKEI